MKKIDARTKVLMGLVQCYILGLTMSGAKAADVLKLRVADSFPPTHYISVQITQWWMDQVKQRTHGGVDFEYFPAEQLGKAKDLLSLTQSGVVDIGYVAPAFVSEKLPLSAVAELPLNFANSCQGTEAYYKLATTGIVAKQEFEPSGVRALFTFVLPPYQVFLRKELKLGAASLVGLKLRTTGGAKELMLRTLGAVPVQIPSPDVYQALSRGTIDGMLFPYGSIFSYDVQDLVKTASVRSNFGSFVVTYMISERKWQSLPSEIRKVDDRSRRGDGTSRLRNRAARRRRQPEQTQKPGTC